MQRAHEKYIGKNWNPESLEQMHTLEYTNVDTCTPEIYVSTPFALFYQTSAIVRLRSTDRPNVALVQWQ